MHPQKNTDKTRHLLRVKSWFYPESLADTKYLYFFILSRYFCLKNTFKHVLLNFVNEENIFCPGTSN